MKLHVYICDADRFLRGKIFGALQLEDTSGDAIPDSWIFAGEIDVDINVDRQTITNKALAILEETEQKERAEHQVKMDLLEKRKQELLSIEYKP